MSPLISASRRREIVRSPRSGRDLARGLSSSPARHGRHQPGVKSLSRSIRWLRPVLCFVVLAILRVGCGAAVSEEQLGRMLLKANYTIVTQHYNTYLAEGPTSATTYGGYHPGIDFRAQTPLPVYSPVAGVVGSTSTASGRLSVLIDGSNDYFIFMHLSSFNGLIPGSRVEVGDQIGLSGAVPAPTPGHLHVEVRTGNQYAAYYFASNTNSGVNKDPLSVITLSDAIRQPGVLVSWGSISIPLSLYDGQKVVQIAAGWGYNLVLKADGTVVGWGSNQEGQATAPRGLSNVVQISAGSAHGLALKDDGTVVAWGDNRYGQSTVPPGLNNVTQIAAGGTHSLALKSDGTLVAWGDNSSGQCTVPSGLSNLVQISACPAFELYFGERSYSMALRSDGMVFAWGNWADNSNQVIVPATLSNVIQISAGYSHALALKSDGTVVAWGAGGHGQRDIPGGLSNVVRISAGKFHNLALKSDGIVVAWGSSGYWEGNTPPGLRNVAQIAAGVYQSLALTSRGRSRLGRYFLGGGHGSR